LRIHATLHSLNLQLNPPNYTLSRLTGSQVYSPPILKAVRLYCAEGAGMYTAIPTHCEVFIKEEIEWG
jgi:hypothetical protein